MSTSIIRQCSKSDADSILSIINIAAMAYQGNIPAECWRNPYMSIEKLLSEFDNGVRFSCMESNNTVLGVMGLQPVEDVTLIRHAYVGTTSQRRGVGTEILAALRSTTRTPMLVGTWVSATWAINFYQKHGFQIATPNISKKLLPRYWSIPQRQIDASVVLFDEAWQQYSDNLISS